MDRIALVGGGPSLTATEGELVAILREGAKLCTTNGAYHWCLARNLTPQTQIVLDARESNARFLEPAVPRCNYLLASTCHPAVWDAVRGRPNVWVYHPFVRSEPIAAVLDAFYCARNGRPTWQPVPGGTTVMTRALIALLLLGYRRFDVFGLDSCWLDGQHHAYEQIENASEKRLIVRVSPSDHPENTRDFEVAAWHLKQLEDMLLIIRENGEHMKLHVHGDGLLAHILRTNASYAVKEM